MMYAHQKSVHILKKALEQEMMDLTRQHAGTSETKPGAIRNEKKAGSGYYRFEIKSEI
jgi:hypothetical protein